jgi:FeS assembly SUF system protein
MSENAPSQGPENAAGASDEETVVDPFTAELIRQLKTVFDPEIPVDIYELGLIYRIDVADNKDVTIDMTLTAPACPVAGEMPGWVKDAVARVPGVGEVAVNMVFDPPWTPERMSEEARLELNMF